MGTSGTVLAGPTRKDNYDWYQIRLGDGPPVGSRANS